MQSRRIGKLSLGSGRGCRCWRCAWPGPTSTSSTNPPTISTFRQEQLEADLEEEGATSLAVSHDRAFVRAVGTRFFRIGRRKLEEVESPEPFFAELLAE